MFASKDVFLTPPSGYTISRSVRLRSSASAYFNRTPGSASNQKTWTWSGWVKRGILGTRQNIFGAATGGSSDTQYLVIAFTASDTISAAAANAGTTQLSYATNAVYRDPSAWYHIVVYFDALNSVFNIYVNNVLQTLTTTTAISNVNYSVNSAVQHNIGKDVRATTNTSYVDGYLTEINFIDGQALTPSSFGTTNATTGVWQPAKYTGTYGTNGFYLNFSDNSNNTATTIGKDYSGNGNNWTPNNISVTAGSTYDSMIDVPTMYADGGNGRGNYVVANPIQQSANVSISNGNLTFTGTNATIWGMAASTIFPSSGKWYCESTVAVLNSQQAMLGVIDSGANFVANTGQMHPGVFTNGMAYFAQNGNRYYNNTSSAYGATYAVNDIICMALDVDASPPTLTFYKNNTSQGTITLNSGVLYSFVWSANNSSAWAINAGQRPFTYTPPSGFVALNTQNLPAPTISNGALYMAATLYTGNGTSQSINNSVNGISFQPDYVWLKSRSTADNNQNQDSVRGATKRLFSNLTDAESTSVNSLTSFNSNGFSVGADANYNGSGYSFVAWQWKAGGSSSSNTNGSITSTVSAGATQGFSVVTYTGTGANATVGHGLGVAPSMIILKSRVSATNWVVYHANLTSAAYVIQLNLTNAQSSSPTIFNSTAPTSSVFSIGTSSASNDTSMVAYCFAAVKAFSAFGSYTGNSSADGSFVYLGFRPKYFLLKRIDTAGYDWFVLDSSRNTYNVTNSYLYPDLSNAEASAFNVCDFLSNGIKFRDSRGDWNGTGATYIYMAFAENPFKNALAR